MRMKRDFLDSISVDESVFDAAPVVGVHVHRKVESMNTSHYSIEEYMEWAEVYYQIQDRLQRRNVTRRVYVASDDPTVLPEIRNRYPRYQVLGNVRSTEDAQSDNRYSQRSLRGLLADLSALSKCEFLICRFSSNFCRLAYELTQIRRGDSGRSFHSLDDGYHFGSVHYRLRNDYVAVEKHTASMNGEISLRVGDLLTVEEIHGDGFATGVNTRTEEKGRFPLFKVEEQWKTVDFPVLDEAP
ncbi:unnamed protein product [Heligmosomoides polygyrus]|uniref:SH3 domain-containing protein n=1 Tax=Heligmosomoides polygyrus TaxID=6339 RepID=A0A3P7YSJ2_HELPZ|nr:unnamed protein product [Heligmosomoides polygyrus]